MVQSTNKIAMFKFSLAATAYLALSACSSAQIETQSTVSEPSPGPALWTVSDEDTTLHLLGLAPVLPTGTHWQTETIMTAFTAAGLVVMEADPTDPEAQAAQQAAIPALGLNTDGGTLSATLSEDQRAELNAITTALGAPLQALDVLKPWLASIQIGVLSISRGDYDLANTPAAALGALANEADTPVQSLEGPTFLLTLMAGFSESEQISMLMHTARTLRDNPTQQAQLADAWLAGDVETVGTILHGTDASAWSSPAMYDAMLVQRNAAWAVEIERLLAEETGTVFVAVGLGHLAGEDSLVTVLSRKGTVFVRQ